ncbi:MAG: glycosyltransferase family 9 protein [Pseudomonadota bacterium]
MLTKYFPSPYRSYPRHFVAYFVSVLYRRNHEAVERPHSVKKILLVNMGHMGDVILSLGLLRTLRETFPSAEISILVGPWNAEIVRISDSADETFEYFGSAWAKRTGRKSSFWHSIAQFKALRRKKFDVVISLHTSLFLLVASVLLRPDYFVDYGAYRVARRLARNSVPEPRDSHIHSEFACLLVQLGIPRPVHDPAIVLSDRAAVSTEGLARTWRASLKGPKILVHPFGAYPEKEWPIDRWGALIERLVASLSARVVITGAPGDKEKSIALRQECNVEIEDLTGQTSCSDLAVVIQNSDLIVTVDGGPMHLAAAIGTPVVAIFGPTDPKRWGPVTERAMVLYHPTDCTPCNYSSGCAQTPGCMEKTSVEEVLGAVRFLLSS